MPYLCPYSSSSLLLHVIGEDEYKMIGFEGPRRKFGMKKK
jgi:hypothetical protein